MRIWSAVLRQHDGEITVTEVWSLAELHKSATLIDLRMRYNADIRLITMRLPDGTERQHVFDAIDRLTADERLRLYQIPTHPLGYRRRRRA